MEKNTLTRQRATIKSHSPVTFDGEKLDVFYQKVKNETQLTFLLYSSLCLSSKQVQRNEKSNKWHLY